MKDKLVAICLIVIMILNIADVLTDIQLEVPLWHILEEGIIVLLSGALALLIILDMYKRTKKLSILVNSLKESEQKVKNITKQFRDIRHQYFVAIQEQFDNWKLSESEKEIALLMLKGLNFQEIARIRNTKEKTARQQASSVYAKSGLEGRHELSAWFIEDLMSANMIDLSKSD